MKNDKTYQEFEKQYQTLLQNSKQCFKDLNSMEKINLYLMLNSIQMKHYQKIGQEIKEFEDYNKILPGKITEAEQEKIIYKELLAHHELIEHYEFKFNELFCGKEQALEIQKAKQEEETTKQCLEELLRIQ